MLRPSVCLICVMCLGGTSWGSEVTVQPYVGGYTFAESQELTTRPVYGLRVGYFFTDNLAAEASADHVSARATADNRQVRIWKYRGEALYRLRGLAMGQFVPHLAAGAGAATFAGARQETAGLVDYGAGLSYIIGHRLAVRTDVRHVFLPKNSRNNLEYTLGLAYVFGSYPVKSASVIASGHAAAPTPEGDRIPPGEREQHSTLTEAAPPAQPLPSQALPTRKPSDTANPPSAPPEPARKLAHQPPAESPTEGPEGGPGGPAVKDATRPETGKQSPPAETARLIPPGENCCTDADRDGVPDICDRCPDTPAGTKVDRNGCPERKKVCITLNVMFDFDKSTIKPEFEPDLARVTSFLGVYPTATAIIEGHTDSTGPSEYNHWLSFRRADSIIRHLITTYGIRPDRLAARGYGESRPVADNGTIDGRRKNRRIEAIIDCGIEPPP